MKPVSLKIKMYLNRYGKVLIQIQPVTWKTSTWFCAPMSLGLASTIGSVIVVRASLLAGILCWLELNLSHYL